MTKNLYKLAVLAPAIALPVFGGETINTGTTATAPGAADPFERAIRPISNPTLFDLALPRTGIHGIFIHQTLPDQVATTLGNLPVGGDLQVYAVQAEYAFSDMLSLVATKDGYIDFNPDRTLTSDEGFANIAAGLKQVLVSQPDSRYLMSGTATIELPLGDSEVLQGEGDGGLNLIVNQLKLVDAWQFAGSIGTRVPFNDDDSTIGFASMHASYAITPKFIPLVEVNWFRVIDDGSGRNRFDNQADGAVPGVIRFEGGDLINLGASNASDHADIVTFAAGFRYLINDRVQAGLAYELPLTDEENNLMEQRVTADLIWKF